VYCKKRSACS